MKIAVITGASSGMGWECAIRLWEQFPGLDEIWAVGRRKERLVKLEEKVNIPVRKFVLDLSQEKEREILKAELERLKPQVKFLVNAAGFGKIGNVCDLPEKDQSGMVQVNCTALTAVTTMVLPFMPQNSRILQFASSAAFLPQPGFAVYAASKAYVLSYSRALAVELKKKNIYVTAVCPGPVETEFFGIALDGGKLAPIKKITMAEPKKVVKKALMDSMKGKRISVYGPWMKAFYVLCRIVPHEILMGFINW